MSVELVRRQQGIGPYDPIAVANDFIALANNARRPVDQMKLQKLVYYGHGYSLALFDCPLLDEEVQAWPYGPVVPTLYSVFRNYGNDPITKLGYDRFKRAWPKSVPALPESAKEARAIIHRVWREYGKYTGIQLSNLTHQANAPWSITRSRNKYNLTRPAIPNVLIRNYFRRLVGASYSSA